MPRNSTGLYVLPSGNPVVSGTPIESTWANTTLSDVAAEITGSLDRQGRGAMLAPLKLSDGTIGTPGLSWNAEPTSGSYRKANGQVWYAIGGVDVFGVTAAGLEMAPDKVITVGGAPLVIPAGSAMLFAQAAAPLGWTKSLTHNDKALRVVNSSGGGSGGTHTFSNCFNAGRSSAGTQLSVAHLPSGAIGSASGTTGYDNEDHSHNYTDNYNDGAGGFALGSGVTTAGHAQTTNGRNQLHSHNFSVNVNSYGGNALHAHGFDVAVQYVDVLICTKD